MRGDAETAGKAGEGAQVFASVVAALEGEHGLGRETKLVGDGDPDALGADVEGEVARRKGSVGHKTLRFQLNVFADTWSR